MLTKVTVEAALNVSSKVWEVQVDLLNDLRSLGILLAIDDFGTGTLH